MAGPLVCLAIQRVLAPYYLCDSRWHVDLEARLAALARLAVAKVGLGTSTLPTDFAHEEAPTNYSVLPGHWHEDYLCSD